jgi:hypothetical protein
MMVVGAVGLGLSQLSMAKPAVVVVLAGLVVGPLLLARKGLKFIDIATVVGVAWLTVGFMLPAIQHTKVHAGGRKSYPTSMPVKLNSLILRSH